MKILILGGDGFCGWPSALHLSNLGHEVAIVDNLSRRQIDIELECESLTPIHPMGERLRAWQEVSGRDIAFHNFNVAVNYQRLLDLLKDWQPQAIVHFAEQRAAPYSMKSSTHKRHTVRNNLNATNNARAAVDQNRSPTSPATKPHRCDRSKIPCMSLWRAPGTAGATSATGHKRPEGVKSA